MNAHSIDLRQRIFNYNLTHSVRQTAEVFRVSPDTVQRLKNLFCETGDLAPRPCNAAHEHAVSPEGEMYLQVLLKEQPDMTLQQLCENYQLVYGVTVGTTTMHNLLKRLGFSRKKKHSTILKSTARRTKPKKTIISMR
jgi:putative transposase